MLSSTKSSSMIWPSYHMRGSIESSGRSRPDGHLGETAPKTTRLPHVLGGNNSVFPADAQVARLHGCFDRGQAVQACFVRAYRGRRYGVSRSSGWRNRKDKATNLCLIRAWMVAIMSQSSATHTHFSSTSSCSAILPIISGLFLQKLRTYQRAPELTRLSSSPVLDSISAVDEYNIHAGNDHVDALFLGEKPVPALTVDIEDQDE